MQYAGTAALVKSQVRLFGGDVIVVAHDPAVQKAGKTFADDLLQAARSGNDFLSECSRAFATQRRSHS